MAGSVIELERTWWIDDAGEWHSAEDFALLPGCGTATMTRSQIEHFALRHLKLVRVDVRCGTIQVKWDLKEAAPAAVSSLCSYMDSARHESAVELEFFFGGWIKECYSSRAAALNRIFDVHESRTARPPRDIRIELQPLEAAASESPLMKRGIDLWKSSHTESGWLDAQFIDLLPRLVLFRAHSPRRYHLVVVHVGAASTAIQCLGTHWAYSSYGKTLNECQPDQRYADHLAPNYMEVLHTSVPRFDHIAGPVAIGNTDPILLCYRRLLLPLQLGDGNRVVASLCEPKISASLTSMGAA